jgi:hypothetical protein
VNAVEAADDVAVDHVDDRLGDRVVDRLVGRHALLDDHRGDLEAFLDDRHLVALLAVEALHVGRVAHGHDAHAVGARVGLDDHERLLVDAVLGVLGADAAEQPVDVRREALLAGALLEVDLAAHAEVRVDEPRVDAEELAEFVRDRVVGLEVMRLQPVVPARRERRRDRLVDVPQDVGRPGRQVVVEQHHARVEVADADAPPAAHDRLEQQRAGVRDLDLGRRGDVGDQRADAHAQARPA